MTHRLGSTQEQAARYSVKQNLFDYTEGCIWLTAVFGSLTIAQDSMQARQQGRLDMQWQ